MRRFAVLTSGGDSPGMNPAIASVTRTGLNFGLEVVGVLNGYRGLLDEEFLPLDVLKVSGKNRDPGTFLQTSRCPEFHEEAGQLKAIEILRRRGIEGLIVIGGDGSLTGAQALHRRGFPVVGIPGTIDNDIYGTEMGIGVDTALNTIIHLVDMIRATAASHRRCFVVEVMGRESGYLALMTTISSGCQVAVVPEYRMNPARIIEKLARRFEHNHNNSVIIVAEGVCSGAEFMEQLKAAGPIQQEMRLTVLGHVQRGGVPTHYDRLLGSRMGERAVLALTEGQSGVMVAQAEGQMRLRNLDEILGKRKPLPPDAVRVARNLGTEFGDAPDNVEV